MTAYLQLKKLVESEGICAIRFAVLPYLNASVFVHYLKEIDKNAELTICRPNQSCAYLIEDQVDAAIIPIIDFFDAQGVQIVDHLGICANGPVKSVFLRCRRPVGEIRTVRLDPASKTSNVLARILLENHFGISRPICYDLDLEDADAEVIIADRALKTQFDGVCYDMALEWQNMTGFGFVFAVWACRNTHSERDRIVSILKQSLKMGTANVSYLSKMYAENLQLPEDFCEQYLTKWIRYEIGPPEIEGMELFRQFYCQMSAEVSR